MALSRQGYYTMHNGAILYHTNGYDVIACEKCGFYHLDPIPDQDIYSEEYYQKEKPRVLERIKEDLRWWELVYRERFDLFEKIVHWTRRRILDIGSGYGYFLDYAARRGWFAVGMEPSREAGVYSQERGQNVIGKYFTEAIPGNPYDVIHMNEVLEHVPDPRQVLANVRDSLTQGGIVCAVVPNDFNPLQQFDENHWISPPWHINYFSIESLQRIMQETGFQIIHQNVTFPMEFFLFMGDNYINNDEIGRKAHKRRKEFELTLDRLGMNDFKNRLYQAFLSLGIGREILMIGQKNEISNMD